MAVFSNSNKKKLTFLFFSIFFLIGIFIFSDYGMSIDEDNTRIVGFLYLESIFRIFNPENLEQIKSIIVEQENAHLNLDIVPSTGPIFDAPMAYLELIFQIEDSRKYFLLRHFFTFLIFFISVYFFFLIVKKRYNCWSIGILGALLLIISPRIFANSFYNSKDIIFLSLFIIDLYVGINFLEKKDFKNGILFSVLSGLTINARIFGLFLPPLIFLIYFINILREKSNKKKSYNPLILTVILTTFFIFLFWPYFLWENPIENFFYSLKVWSEQSLNIYNYYLGLNTFTTDLPWHYHIVWISVTTPIFYIILFLIGFIFIFRRIINRLFKIEKNDSYDDLWRGNKELQDLIFFLIFLVPLIFATNAREFNYDGWRVLYFIYPSFLLISLLGLHLIKVVFFKKRKNYFYALTLVCIIPTIFWMVNNHPYQNTYFNLLAGKNFDKKFEMDYFGISNKNALEFLMKNETKNIKVYSISSPIDLNLSKKILKKEIRDKINIIKDINNADYIINNYRDWTGKTDGRNLAIPENFKIMHQIKVNKVAINTIYKKK